MSAKDQSDFCNAQTAKEENKFKQLPSKLVPYRTNFLLPVNYSSSPNNALYQAQNPNQSNISHVEMKFQFSLKYPVFPGLIGDRNSWYVAYSQLSFWQAYQDSAFFRESNYSPEMFLRFRTDYEIVGWQMAKTDFGFVHQSNGLGGKAERCWNRLYIRQLARKNDWEVALTVWYKMNWFNHFGLHEYNADITDYLGHSLISIKKNMGRQILSLELRNQFDSGFSRGFEVLTWSYSLKNSISVFLQATSGYGQSLGEYNHYANTFGIGFGFSH